MKRFFLIVPLALLVGCSADSDDSVVIRQQEMAVKALQTEQTGLEERVRRLEGEIVRMRFEDYTDSLSRGLEFVRDEETCAFELSRWEHTRDSLQSFLSEFAVASGAPDASMETKARQYVDSLNKACDEALLW